MAEPSSDTSDEAELPADVVNADAEADSGEVVAATADDAEHPDTQAPDDDYEPVAPEATEGGPADEEAEPEAGGARLADVVILPQSPRQ